MDINDCISPKQFIDKAIKEVRQNGNFAINIVTTAAGKQRQ